MGMNNIVLEGQLVAPFKHIQKNNQSFGVTTYVANINKKNRFIRVIIFDTQAHMFSIAKKYLIEQNKGKRMCVIGKLSFDNLDNLQIVANDIEFLDKFIDENTIQENKVEFDEDELP